MGARRDASRPRRAARAVASALTFAAPLASSTAVALATLFFTPRAVYAQRTVPVHQEPRHRLLHEVGSLKVLDVQILPGDTTLFHVHATPITYVTIGTSSTDSRSLGGDWSNAVPRNPPPGTVGAVRAVTSYADAPLTHQVTNIGSTLFRLIAVPNMGPGAEGEATGPMPGEVVDDSRWFRWRRVTLAPGQATEWHTAGAPIAAVAIRGDRTWVDRRDAWASTLARSGDVGVLEAGAGYRIRNTGTAEAEVVLVEVR